MKKGLRSGWAGFLLVGTLLVPVLAATLTFDEALDQLHTYDHGQPNAALAVIEREVGRHSGQAAARSRLAERLMERLMSPDMSAASRLFLARQLALVAGEAQAPALGKLLENPENAALACLVLRSLSGPAATQTLVQGLHQARGATRIALVNLVGERGDQATVDLLGEWLAIADRQLAEAAARALARIGTRAAAERLAAEDLPEELGPALRSARLEVGWQLARAGYADDAEAIFRRYTGLDQPLWVQVAALTGLVEATGARAWPELRQAAKAREPELAHQAIALMRGLPPGPAVDGMRQALEGAVGERRLLLLSALAERGDPDAWAEVTRLADGPDEAGRGLAAQERRRLAWTADPAVRTRLSGAVAELEEVVEVLSPTPYGTYPSEARRAQIQAELGDTGNVVVYLDCGVRSRVEGDGVVLRQRNGSPWRFAGADRAASAPLGTVAFEGSELVFEIRGLDPAKRYMAGFSWWDYDGNGRIQSVALVGGEPGTRVEVLAPTRLPAYQGSRQTPVFGRVPLDPAMTRSGSMQLAFQRRAGPNAVVSEVWLAETSQIDSEATAVVLTGGETMTVKVDLTPPTEGTRVLLVTGIDYPGHPWQETAPLLKQLIEDDPRLRVRIVEDPAALGSPRLHEYDVAILHFMDWEVPGPGPAARENLVRFVQGGKGLMLTHFACGAWDGGEWPEFVELAGRIWDPQLRGHDPHGVFRVDIVEPEHPIMRGIEPFETLDELYTCLAGETPIQVLAQATSKVDGEDYPIIFVLEVGQGRVFHSVLGHDGRAYTHHPAVGELMRRGCAWVAGLEPVVK